MRREIADSDDENELILPPVKSVRAASTSASAPFDANVTVEQLEQPDPVLNIDFAGLCSPTQRISSYDGNDDNDYELNTSNVLDSSTNRFLNEVAPHDSSNTPADPRDQTDDTTVDMGGNNIGTKSIKDKNGKKRSREQQEDGSHRTSSKDNSRKRAKTYGSSAASDKISNAVEFQAILNENRDDGPQNNSVVHQPDPTSRDSSDVVSVEPRTQYTSPLDLSLHLSPIDEAAVEALRDDNNVINELGQRNTIHPMQTPQAGFFGANLRGGTASKSSIGNYQSFSIDPSALGMDFGDINPFGRLSQASLGAEDDTEDSRAIAEIFRASASSRRDLAKRPTELADTLVCGVDDMATSPVKSVSHVDVPEDFNAPEAPPQVSPTFSPITNPDDGDPSLEIHTPLESLGQSLDEQLVQTKSNPYTEGPAQAQPKKRGRKPKQRKSDVTNVNENDDLDELHFEEPLVSRDVRAGTVDSVSNVSDISQTNSTSRKDRRKRTKNTEMKPPEALSKKLPSSDLGLDSKAVIGLSPERYVPRPSKRRGRSASDSKPQPQTRSAATVEEEEELSTTEVPDQSVSAKKGRGRKAKTKQTKTATANHPKRKHDLLDNDEEVEVVKQPTSIDTDAIAEESSNKELGQEEPTEHDLDERGLNNAKNEDEDYYSDAVKNTARHAKIVVDVPVLARKSDHEELPPPIPEPKKRGRKRKKAIEEPVQQEDTDEQTDDRPALAERNTNIELSHKNTDSSKPLTTSCEIKSEDEHQVLTVTGTETTENTAPQTPDLDRKPPPTSKQSNNSILKPTTTTSLLHVRGRIGLSKRHSIPSLLRKVDRTKEPPKVTEKKEKVTKRLLEEREQERIAREEALAEGREYVPVDALRGRDGMLVEWDF